MFNCEQAGLPSPTHHGGTDREGRGQYARHLNMARSAVSTPTSKGARKSAAPRPRLLVVDDDAAIREVAAAMLAEEGYRVMTAEDGVEALELVAVSPPDLVITDLRMPRMSGYELLKVLRAQFPRLPVIAISGEFSGDTLPPGVIADAFLSKDFYVTPRLRTTIAELLSVAPLRSVAREEQPHVAE